MEKKKIVTGQFTGTLTGLVERDQEKNKSSDAITFY